MKPSTPAPKSVPRLNSLLHRLQKTRGPDDEPYLDQLMMFLDDPPDGTRDRWKQGAEMCAAWSITTTGTSVWRLYRSYMIEWRARIALQVDDLSAETPETLGKKATQIIALRTCEMLTDPDAAPATLISLARLDLRQKALEFARQRHFDGKRGDTERALTTLMNRSFGNWEAAFAIKELRKALDKGPSRPSPFPPGFPPEILAALQK